MLQERVPHLPADFADLMETNMVALRLLVKDDRPHDGRTSFDLFLNTS